MVEAARPSCRAIARKLSPSPLSAASRSLSSSLRCVPPDIAPSRIAAPGQNLTTRPQDVALHAGLRPPALYLAYNKSTQLAAQQHFPAHVACRTMHSLAFRAMRMFEQQHRLERKLTGGEMAELLAIPALEPRQPTRPSYSYCSQMFTKPSMCKLPQAFAGICQL